MSVRHLGEQLRSWHTLSAWLRGSPQRGLRERLSAFPTPGFGGDGWLKERLTALPPAIPPALPSGSPLAGISFSIPVRAPRPSRAALRLSSGAPPTGLGVSPHAGVRGPSGTPTHRGEKVLVAVGRQRRWDLWIVDRWLPFHRRFRGVRPVRVPSNGRAAPVGLLLEQYVPAPTRASRCAEGACRGPRSGKFSGVNRDGLGGAAGTLATPFRGRVRHASLPRYTCSAPSGGWRPGPSGGPREGRIWLILPVVICLSQRLSHACLSISTLLL